MATFVYVLQIVFRFRLLEMQQLKSAFHGKQMPGSKLIYSIIHNKLILQLSIKLMVLTLFKT